MPTPISDHSLTPLIRAMDENLFLHFTFDRGQLPDAHVIDSPDILLVDSGFRSDTFNVVSRARFTADNAEAHIRKAIYYFKSKDHDFAWWVTPTSRPLDIETYLVRCGLKQVEHEYGMSMPLKNLPARPEGPAGLTIKRVRTKQDLADFANTIAANWEPLDTDVLKVCFAIEELLQPEDCPMRLFVGYLDGVPVTTSELLVSNGIAGLYSVATKKEYRKRGIGAAITWETLALARDAHIETAILQASAAGRGVYAKLGFVEQCSYAVYKPANAG